MTNGTESQERKRAKEAEWEGLSDREALQKLATELMAKHQLLSEYTDVDRAQVDDIVAGKVTLAPEHEALYKDLRALPWVCHFKLGIFPNLFCTGVN